MKNTKSVLLSVLFLLGALFTTSAQDDQTVYDQMCMLNKQWHYQAVDNSVLQQQIELNTDVSLIQMHLSLVEETLRAKDVSHLTPEQQAKRIEGLDILHSYWVNGVFPTNHYHADRTPYFIDNYGTACAVGQIVIETGYEDFAQLIRTENNNGYIFELNQQYPALQKWADEFGFTMEELAWIQPSYGGPGPCQIMATGQVIQPSCANSCDGVIILGDPGGVPPYTIITMDPCDNLCPGTYTYTIADAMGSSWTTVVTLTAPPAINPIIIVNSQATGGNCDGVVESIVQGGSGPLTYQWYTCDSVPIPGATTPDLYGVCAGDSVYVSVTDVNGCTETSNCLTMSSAGGGCNLTMTTVTADITCFGVCDGSITAIASNGTGPFGFSLDGATIAFINDSVHTFTGLCSGTYLVDIIDADTCTASATVTITEPTELIATASVVSQPTAAGACDGEVNVIASGGTPPYTYLWIACDSSGFTATSQSVTNLCAGDYAAIITDANGCVDTTDCVTLTDPPMNISEQNNSFEVSLYPNPADEKITVELDSNIGAIEISVLNVLGKTVLQEQSNNRLVELDVSQLDAGHYVIRVSNAHFSSQQNVVIQ